MPGLPVTFAYSNHERADSNSKVAAHSGQFLQVIGISLTALACNFETMIGSIAAMFDH